MKNYNDELRERNRKKRVQKTLSKISAVAIIVVAILLLVTIEEVKAQIKTIEQTEEIEASSSPVVPEVIETVVLHSRVTAYNAVPEQTDDTPDITASGKKVQPGFIACPINIKFGTQVIILGEIYTCEDRMNEKYQNGNNFDIYMEEIQDAREWGVQHLQVSIIK